MKTNGLLVTFYGSDKVSGVDNVCLFVGGLKRVYWELVFRAGNVLVDHA